MPDFVLIAIGALVPILALTLALACGHAREVNGDAGADTRDGGLADDARA